MDLVPDADAADAPLLGRYRATPTSYRRLAGTHFRSQPETRRLGNSHCGVAVALSRGAASAWVTAWSHTGVGGCLAVAHCGSLHGGCPLDKHVLNTCHTT